MLQIIVLLMAYVKQTEGTETFQGNGLLVTWIIVVLTYSLSHTYNHSHIQYFTQNKLATTNVIQSYFGLSTVVL